MVQVQQAELAVTCNTIVISIIEATSMFNRRHQHYQSQVIPRVTPPSPSDPHSISLRKFHNNHLRPTTGKFLKLEKEEEGERVKSSRVVTRLIPPMSENSVGRTQC